MFVYIMVRNIQWLESLQILEQYNALGISSPDDQYGVNPNAHTNAVNNDIFSGFYIYKAADLTLTQDKVTYDIGYI